MAADTRPPATRVHHGVHVQDLLRLDRSFYVASDAFGARSVTWLYAVLFALVALMPFAVSSGRTWALAFVVPLLGAYVYKLTIVMHEASHRTLFATRWANHVAGVLTGGLLVSSFHGYTKSHWQHHRSCGTDHDSGEGDYLHLEAATPAQLLWHLVRPLTGVTFLGAFREYAGLGQAHDDDGRPPRKPAPPGETASQIAATVVMQALVALVATGLWRHPWLIVVFPLTGVTFGLFFSRIRAFCEHVSARRAQGQCYVRTHLPNPLDALLFYTLNMNYHVEHHLYPQVPACQLPRLHRRMRDAGCYTPDMVATSILGTIAGRLRDARELHARPLPPVHA